MFIKNKKGQSMLEYAILLAVIVAGIMIMNIYVKRGFQGGMKDAADKLGDQFSAGNTQVFEKRAMGTNQTIVENTATTAGTGIGAFVAEAQDVVSQGVYVLSEREGGQMTSTMQAKTDAAAIEKTRFKDYGTDEQADFTDPF